MSNNTKKLRLIMQQLHNIYNELAELIPESTQQIQYRHIPGDAKSEKIIEIVTKIFNANPFAPNRKKDNVFARHALRYLLRTETLRSHESIAELTGGCDHSTAIHSIETAKALYQTDDRFKSLIDICRIEINL